MQKKPRISIGIPIYYGETFLKETLDNILEQNFNDFEIIITDNNPGGEPAEIAELYSKQYGNITYIKHKSNIGALINWNSIIDYIQGDFFIYAGAHDLWSPELLKKLLSLLENNEDAILVYAPSYWMSPEGEITSISTGFVDTTGQNIINRFNSIFWGGQDALYGLIKTSALKKTCLQKQIIGSGALWLSELSLIGNFIVCTDVKRYRRINRESQNREERLIRYHKTLFKKKRILLFPYWRFFFSYFSIFFKGKMSFYSRFRLIISIFSSFLLKYGHEMILDLISLIKRIIKLKI